MKKTVYLFVLILFALYACEEKKVNQTDDPVKPPEKVFVDTPPSNDSIAIPEGYKILGEAKGDLNKDSIAERVLVYDTKRSTDFGTEREIHVFTNNKTDWKLWHKSVGAVLPSESGGMMGDPFMGVDIIRRCIVLKHFGGSRQKWDYTHRFRYQNDDWELIGATVLYGSPCEEWENLDYNLSTGKIVYKKEQSTCDEEDNEVKKMVEKVEFANKLEVLPTMDKFSPGNTPIKLGSSEKEFYF